MPELFLYIYFGAFGILILLSLLLCVIFGLILYKSVKE